jgi:hypothetical protein
VNQKPEPDLIAFMKTLRLRSGKSLKAVEECMNVGADTYRHVESRLRPPRDFQHGFIAWLRDFLRCVDATPEDEKHAIDLAARAILDQFADWMDDLRNRDGN